MNISRNLSRGLIQGRLLIPISIRKIHVPTACLLRYMPDSYVNNQNVNSSLWFTNLPSRKKRAISLMGKKKLRNNHALMSSSKRLAIACKRPEFNHYKGRDFGKFDVIPLASKGWHHRKSKGDHFTLLNLSEHPAFLSSENLPVTFEETGLSSAIIKQIQNLGISHPTVIQAKSIPVVLQGNNLLITAETGCGKTLAYLAPIINNILKIKASTSSRNVLNSPLGVILIPTRELAVQIGTIAHKLCTDLGVKSLVFFGGKTKSILLRPNFDLVDLLISTPGVFSKLLTHKIYKLDLCRHFVLDEADTLLDDSFNEKVTYIFKRHKLGFGGYKPQDPQSTQLCLVSATKPRSWSSILSNLNEDSIVEIKTRYLHKIQPHIPQEFRRVGKATKPEELLKIMKKNQKKHIPTMIFSNKAATSHWINIFLESNGIKSTVVTSKMKFEERMQKYQKFREGVIDVISCTDVASRGIDCPRVKHVINYEFPKFMADYVHRCGRTGRINHDENCRITSFISSPSELHLLHKIEKAARTSMPLQDVNNNITRILNNRAYNKGEITAEPPAKYEATTSQPSQ